MTVCDDWTDRCFSALEPLADAGYAVFVLDDSAQPATLPPGLIGKVEVLRRESRRGAKGGNLNHWLRRCGPQFVYAIVLDADSIIPVETVDALLATAEHPANGDVAIVQSKIDVEVEAPSTFARAVGAAARPRARILERVHARLGVLLSSGHNELLRLAPVFAIGGFDERLTNEDTVLSLHLAARGWRTVLADVWSYNAEPDTTAAYNRRTVRWARQTLELFQHDWYEVPLRLKLLLCRHLMMFVLPILGTWLLGLSLWIGPDDPWPMLAFLGASVGFFPGFERYGLTIWTSTCLLTALFASRTVMARREGVRWRSILSLALVAGAPYLSLIGPLVLGLGKSLFGRRVAFVPTSNRHALSREARMSSRLLRGLAATCLLVLLVAGAMKHPGALFVGFNAVWLVLILGSPMCLMIAEQLDRARTARTARRQGMASPV